MERAINQILGIKAEDSKKISSLAPIFFLVGLAYVAGVVACQTLFVSRFGVRYLPLMYLAEAGILPLQLWFFSKITQKFSQGKIIKILYSGIVVVLAACTGFLAMIYFTGSDMRFFYPLLFILGNVVLRILVPVAWTLADGVCEFQQGKRMYPLLSTLFILGGVVAGILANILADYFEGFGTEIVFMLSPSILILSALLWRKVIGEYFLDAELEEDEDNRSDMHSVISAVWSSRFLKTALITSVILLCLFYVIDYQFFFYIQMEYPGSDEMTRYFGVFVAVVYAASLLTGMVLNRLVKCLGIGNVMLGMGIIVTGVLLSTGIMTHTARALESFFVADLVIDILSFTVIPPINQVFYKLLPQKHRAGVTLFFAGAMNAGGKLVSSGLTSLHSFEIIGITFLSALGLVLAICYLVLMWQQKHLYISALIQSMQSYSVDLSELGSLSPGQKCRLSELEPLIKGLESENYFRASISLELCKEIDNSDLVPYIHVFLSNPDPRLRLAAIKALQGKDLGGDQLMEIRFKCISDPEEAVRQEAVSFIGRCKAMESEDIGIFKKCLNDSSPAVISEAAIALIKFGDEEIFQRYERIAEALSDADDEELLQFCRVVSETGLKGYSQVIVELLKHESPQVRVSAVRCLGKLDYTEAVAEIAGLYPMADFEMRKEVERALLSMGRASLPVIMPLLESRDIDIWHLGVVTIVSVNSEATVREKLAKTCLEKAESLSLLHGIADLVEQNGGKDLAELYRLRQKEITDIIIRTCWRVLELDIDVNLVEKLNKAIDGAETEKREKAVEIMLELSGKHPLIGKILQIIAGNPEMQKTCQEECEMALEKSTSDFPDQWLGKFISYILLKNKKEVS